jgi:hypothetical protein
MSTESRACKKCRCPLTFVTGEGGKPIPLDTRSPVYRIAKDMLGNEVAVRDREAFVSHFCTCPEANQFSKGKR